MKKIAVTGGLSCGKSSVCQIFKELGAYVVSADEVVHQLLSPNTKIGKQVTELLGFDIVVNGQIDRSIIAKKVFQNPRVLNSLEKIVHPAVKEEIEKQYQSVSHDPSFLLFVVEIPLLFEIGADADYDETIAVVADETKCKTRFKKSDEEYQQRMARQLSLNEKASKASYVIDNNDSIEELRKCVKETFAKLIK